VSCCRYYVYHPPDWPSTQEHVLVNGAVSGTGCAAACVSPRPYRYISIYMFHPGARARQWNHLRHRVRSCMCFCLFLRMRFEVWSPVCSRRLCARRHQASGASHGQKCNQSRIPTGAISNSASKIGALMARCNQSVLGLTAK
jgi:hypothetical protein